MHLLPPPSVQVHQQAECSAFAASDEGVRLRRIDQRFGLEPFFRGSSTSQGSPWAFVVVRSRAPLEAHHILSSEGITADVIVLNQLSDIPDSAQHILSESARKTGRPIFVDIPQSLVADLYDQAFWRLESKPILLSKVTSAHIYQAAQEVIL